MKHLESAFDGKNRLLNYFTVILMSFMGLALLGNIPLLLAILIKCKGDMEMMSCMLQMSPTFGLSTNVYLTVIFLSFAVGLLILIPSIKVMHNRRFCISLNGRDKIRWKHFFIAFALYFAAMILQMLFLLLFTPQNYVYQFDSKAFFSMLPILVILVPVQTLFEEYLFRGYVMQGMAVASKRVWVALVSPAILFALAHSANPEIGAYGFWIMMLQYLLYGLILGWFTLADDGIEVSWGMHTANNLFLLLFITSEGTALETPAMFYIIDGSTHWWDILLFLVVAVLLWFVMKRIFGWKVPNLKQKILLER